jgi:Replication initiator protein A
MPNDFDGFADNAISTARAIRVEAVPEHGMATIWDADVLIWAASQIVEARDAGLRTSRLMAATPYEILTFIGRGVSARDYHRLKAALDRLQSTTVATSLRQTSERRMHRFSWINEWTERADAHGRADGIDLIVPDWFYRAVLDDALVLTIDREYFKLTGGLERWLYRIVRKHAGRQRAGWRFDFRHLHCKSASRRSNALRSSCAIWHAGNRCPDTGSASNATAPAASFSSSLAATYPQAPVDNLLTPSCLQEPRCACHREPNPRAIRNPKRRFPLGIPLLADRLT